MQLGLFPNRGKLEIAFWEFHLKHPEIYRSLLAFAREWRLRRGSDAHLGIAMLFERVRWELQLQQMDDEVPKLNNNHRAFYSRLLMERNSELEDIFQLRKQRIPPSFGPDNSGLPPSTHINPP